MDIPTDDQLSQHAFDTRHGSPDYGHADTPVPLVGGTAVVRMAEALVAQFGEEAEGAAHLRAAHSRAHDNPYSYCQWKEAARVIGWMQNVAPARRYH